MIFKLMHKYLLSRSLATYSLLLLPCFFSSCNKEEPIPSYIHIDKFDLTTVYANQGSSSNKIVDAWIYVDGNAAGTYEMPCTIPVLSAGTHTITISPGVKENGISDTRISYIYYNNYVGVFTLTPGQITTIIPTTTYAPIADFSMLEDFEGSTHGVCNDIGISDTIMKITTDPADVFEGTGSGVVMLGSSQVSYFGATCNKFALPQGGAPVFLELDYNCNTALNVGIVSYVGSSPNAPDPVLTLRPTSGWNKVYINLTSVVSAEIGATNFGIYFSMLKNPDLSTSYFYLDNVKLVN
jgi:hypothetical protein